MLNGGNVNSEMSPVKLKRPEAASIPTTPGSYQFFDADHRVIYVGKAKNLRSRVSSYFGSHLSLRTQQMMETARFVDWIQVANEVEALILEFSLIQRHKPRFNVRFTDDKSYPFLCVTVVDKWPRATVVRGKRVKGNRYFGPYVHVHAIRDTLDLLLRTFPIRTCTDSKFSSHAKLKKPCLLYHIEQCSAPCVGEISEKNYSELTQKLLKFLEGDTDHIVNRLEADMRSAADDLNFERAARLRDRLSSVKQAMATQQMVGSREEDFDVIGTAEDTLETAVQVFFVRKGRVMGRRGFMVDKVEELDDADLMARILERIYFEDNPLGLPKLVLVPRMPSNLETYEDWLTGGRGSKVHIRVPQRGDKRALQRTVTDNAVEVFSRHRMKRMTDHNSRAQAISELQSHLQMSVAPLRIECYDMSHLSGSDYVGSMVVMEDGLPRKSEYRRFKIRNVDGIDDCAAMEEVLTRRLTNYLEQRAMPVQERDGRFSYTPQLILVDGGKGQLAASVNVLRKLGLYGEISTAALAKQFEDVYIPDVSEPVRIPRQSEALYMLQRIRDESHRFAVRYHRTERDKRMKLSALNGITGLGPSRRVKLTKEFGSIKAVQNASMEELKAVSWLPDSVAENVYQAFN